jgi:hypothetical protein
MIIIAGVQIHISHKHTCVSPVVNLYCPFYLYVLSYQLLPMFLSSYEKLDLDRPNVCTGCL